jgi:hypothetical protein
VKKSTVLAIAFAFVIIRVVMAASSTATWLTGEVRVAGLAILPTAIMALLLILYFDWRAKPQPRILAEPDERTPQSHNRAVPEHEHALP